MHLLSRGYGWVSVVLVGTGLWAAACGGDGGPGDDTASQGGSGGGSASGGGGGEPNTGGFELVRHLPEAGDTNGYALAPLWLEFSSDVDAASLAGEIDLQLGSETLAFEVEVDGPVVLLHLDEIPPLPAKVNVSVGSGVRSSSGAAFSGDSWSFTYPLWYGASEGAIESEGGVALAALPDGELVLVGAAGGGLLASRRDASAGATWSELSVPTLEADVDVQLLGAEVSDDHVFVAWLEDAGSTESVWVAELEDDTFELLGDGPVASGPALRPAFTAAGGRPLVAVHLTNQFRVFGYDEGAGEFAAIGPAVSVPGGAVRELALGAADPDRPVVAAVDADHDLVVRKFDGDAWVNVGTGIDRERTTAGTVRPRLAVFDAEIFLAYLDGEEAGEAPSSNAQVARFDGAWGPVGAALDIELSAQVLDLDLALDADGVPSVAWTERFDGAPRLFVASLEEDDFRVRGGALEDALTTGARVALAIDERGDPQVAVASDGEVLVRRFAGSPELPAGLASRGERGDCAIPEDGDPDFPDTLAKTGCYVDIARRELVSAAIPYGLNSILWSDGAYKRRYMLLPEGETVGFEATGAFEFPVGTIFIKEFYLERVAGNPSTLFPVETRFLVKRCEELDCVEPWQGYSYQWNSLGTAGVLRGATDDAPVDWTVTRGGVQATHQHIYPTRSQCVECHNEPSGRVLGVQAAQLDRPEDYGGVVDNQLHTWAALGLFGDSQTDEDPQLEVDRMPSPPDVGRSLDERARAYFHSNCSHCHQPGTASQSAGTTAFPDLRYEAPLVSGGNICQVLNTASPADSILYVRDGTRGDAQQMPPIATFLTDDRQLPLTLAWIESLGGTCP